MKQAVILSGLRTPIGSYGKSLKNITADLLISHLIDALIRRNNLKTNLIDGLILGHGYQNSYIPNTARMAILKSQLPHTVPGVTVQRQCASGLEAVNIACKDIMLDSARVLLAGGVESMSTIGYQHDYNLRFNSFFARFNKFGPRPVILKLADDGIAPTRLIKDLKTVYMAGTAQRLADIFNIDRIASDEYALRSQTLANSSLEKGRFDIEIEPIVLKNKKLFSKDEHPRQTSLEKLSSLKPVMGTKLITAGNSSGINDAGCLMLISSNDFAIENNIKPLAIYIDSVVVGLDPYQMGLGPVFAIQKLLQKTKLEINQIDLFEINEAFAVQYLACESMLKIDRNKVNVNGGAIALGHPIGMTGARLILSLAHELKIRQLKYGIASLCVGGGMGIATLIKNYET